MVIPNVAYPSSFHLDHATAYILNNLQALNNASFRNYVKREVEKGSTQYIVFSCLMPVLVLLSGLFSGLTLGYLSLDETQLNVLSISGTPQQRAYAEKIKPIRKNGHLLLVTLLLCNMIVNEALPVIGDPILGGGVQSVVVSTALIVIFAEIIPQSLCTRYGLYIGAKMAGFVRVLLWTMGLIAWPVAKILEWSLGSQHGIIYRRTELKELIAMHSHMGEHGGDLKDDTVTIIGATLDLQEKVVSQAMTRIEDVFMLSIEAKLDYDTLRRICQTGHSRVPVYDEVELPTPKVVAAQNKAGAAAAPLTRLSEDGSTMIARRIIGILLVKQCVLLDPGDAIPLRQIPLNKVPFVPNNEPLLGTLDKFQEGRSHMAIVSRFSVEKAASVKQAAKVSLTQRLRHTVGISDDSSSESESDDEAHSKTSRKGKSKVTTTVSAVQGEDQKGDKNVTWDADVPAEEQRHSKRVFPLGSRKSRSHGVLGGSRRVPDVEMGVVDIPEPPTFTTTGLEQLTPADAILTQSDAEDFLQILDPAIMPLGIITLEDVLEELIGEEIYDEFDPHDKGAQLSSYIPPESINGDNEKQEFPTISVISPRLESTPRIARPIAVPTLRGLNFLRSKSAPPIPRDDAVDLVAALHTHEVALQNIQLASSPHAINEGSGLHATAIPISHIPVENPASHGSKSNSTGGEEPAKKSVGDDDSRND